MGVVGYTLKLSDERWSATGLPLNPEGGSCALRVVRDPIENCWYWSVGDVVQGGFRNGGGVFTVGFPTCREVPFHQVGLVWAKGAAPVRRWMLQHDSIRHRGTSWCTVGNHVAATRGCAAGRGVRRGFNPCRLCGRVRRIGVAVRGDPGNRRLSVAWCYSSGNGRPLRRRTLNGCVGVSACSGRPHGRIGLPLGGGADPERRCREVQGLRGCVVIGPDPRRGGGPHPQHTPIRNRQGRQFRFELVGQPPDTLRSLIHTSDLVGEFNVRVRVRYGPVAAAATYWVDDVIARAGTGEQGVQSAVRGVRNGDRAADGFHSLQYGFVVFSDNRVSHSNFSTILSKSPISSGSTRSNDELRNGCGGRPAKPFSTIWP